MGWVELDVGYEVVDEEDQDTWCQIEVTAEFVTLQHQIYLIFCLLTANLVFTACSMSLIRGIAAGDIDIAYAPLRLLSFDIETLVPDDGDQPDARYQPVIQIGNMMTLYGIYTPDSKLTPDF